MKQKKMFQRENRDIDVAQEKFKTKFSSFIQHIVLHMSV